MRKFRNHEPLLTLSAICGCCRSLKPLVRTVKKRKQGSIDPEDPWSKARKNWCLQLLIRLGIIKYETVNGENVPACFDLAKMASLDLHQIAFWDETYQKVKI